jgi:hypothetical protein
MQPQHLPYLLNPGLCYVVLTYPGTYTPLDHAHAGRTQKNPDRRKKRAADFGVIQTFMEKHTDW